MKESKTYKFYQYPRGVNRGGVLDVTWCPTISISSWENNCFLIEIDESGGEDEQILCLPFTNRDEANSEKSYEEGYPGVLAEG